MMSGLSECWVCGRTAEEIRAIFDSETPEEVELAKQASQITWFRSKFSESAPRWRKGIPKDFMDMDFLFVVSNPDQFGAVKVIGELNDARKLMMDWLVTSANTLQKGEGAPQQNANLLSLAKSERELVIRTIREFEGRWRRRLAKEEGENASNSDPAGFRGLGLANGLEFLIAGGLLYYDIQAMLIQFAKNAAAANKTQYHVQAVEVKGFATVPLCDICTVMIKGLRSPQPEVVEEADHRVAPTQTRPPEAPMPAVAPAVPRRTKSQVMAESVPPNASPQFREIIEKLGPATEETAPKSRPLHEHRLKEDWDELVEKNAGQA